MIRALPNLISLFRLILVPIVLRSIWNRQYEWAVLWCGVAGISDALDGYLARKLHAKSRIGAYLDPLADKLLLSGTYLTLGLDRVIPWWLPSIVLGRDFIMGLFIAYAFAFTNIRDFRPTIWGKISTAIQILAALTVLLNRANYWGEFMRSLTTPMLYAAAVATTWSAVHYAWIGARMLRESRRPNAVRMVD